MLPESHLAPDRMHGERTGRRRKALRGNDFGQRPQMGGAPARKLLIFRERLSRAPAARRESMRLCALACAWVSHFTRMP